ncbi:MAG: PhoH family protein [Proteobacteria bacterium]|nr:PhoH family protein [Pseudomonadota bacterium]
MDGRLVTRRPGTDCRYVVAVLSRISHCRGLVRWSTAGQTCDRAGWSEGLANSVQRSRSHLLRLGATGRARLDAGVRSAEVDAALRLAQQGGVLGDDEDLVIPTPKCRVGARSLGQAAYLRALRDYELVFALGPAGTGKTYLAVAMAVSLLLDGRVDRIILSRPAVEAGESLGFLPGDVRDKVDPYLRPLYDALHDMMPGDQVRRRLDNGDIEVAPLAFMRGRTLSNAFVILDEAQNTSAVQMKMCLTRLGENSRMVVTGDLSQIDLPPGTRSGLHDAVETLGRIEGVTTITFSDVDVVRHDLVTRIVRAYDAESRPATGAADKKPAR